MNKTTAQAIGSALTYGRRYGLSALAGIVSDEDDDDGESAMPKPNANEFAGEVKFTPQKSNAQTSNNKTPQPVKTEAKVVKQPKVVSERIQKIKQIFGLSAQIGHTPDEMKAVIGEIIG